MQEASPSERALALAVEAHRGQVRKGSGVPYVFHTVDVAKRLGDVGVRDEDVIVAGLLHDVVEDTAVTLEEVAEQFGARAAGIVDEMTFDEGEGAKSVYLAAFATKSIESLAVKLMDRSANVTDYALERPDYAPKYAGLAHALYAAAFAREAELVTTFGELPAKRMLAEADRLRRLG